MLLLHCPAFTFSRQINFLASVSRVWKIKRKQFFFSVADMPVVTLKIGPNLNPDDIKEGDDVYFECNVKANPKAYKLSWFHNVSRHIDENSGSS